MRKKGAPRDRALAEIAARQHGVVTIAQVTGIGIEGGSLNRRLRSGRLHRIHRGVYAVGHAALSREGRWMAAVLACGKFAVLSHRSAAALWRLLPNAAGPIDVIVHRAGGRRRRPGLHLHRPRSLTIAEVTHRDGIPVTSAARTITDLQGTVPASVLRRAVRQATVLGLQIPEDMEAEATRSELERRFLRLCRRHRLPAPQANVRVGPFLVDFIWQKRRLVVETDGYRYHRGRQAFEDDRARDAELRLHGYDVARFTYRQVLDEPERVVSVLESLLARSADRPGPGSGP